MIIMNLKLDNYYAFKDFEINFSYPKKIINSTIENEFLIDRPNFRFKRVNILMGANASGKSILGKALMNILNFIANQEVAKLLGRIKNKRALIEIDFVLPDLNLYRVRLEFKDGEKFEIYKLEVKKSEIKKRDSYEKAVKKLKTIAEANNINADDGKEEIISVLKNIDSNMLGWLFDFPEFSERHFDIGKCHSKVLNIILKTFDNSIKEVVKSKEVKDTYYIVFKDGEKLIIQDKQVIKENRLSSGTKEGIEIATDISGMIKVGERLFYIDEKFSYVHNELEVAILNTMIELLPPWTQLFFTSHNVEILEMNLPIHSFIFLNKKEKIEVIYPEKICKKNDRKLSLLVKNDVFKTLPNDELLDELLEVCNELKK